MATPLPIVSSHFTSPQVVFRQPRIYILDAGMWISKTFDYGRYNAVLANRPDTPYCVQRAATYPSLFLRSAGTMGAGSCSRVPRIEHVLLRCRC